MTFQVLYFAALAEKVGQSSETITGNYPSLSLLYAELKEKYDFPLAQDQLRVARNQCFCDWSEAPTMGDEIAFIPPVAGG